MSPTLPGVTMTQAQITAFGVSTLNMPVFIGYCTRLPAFSAPVKVSSLAETEQIIGKEGRLYALLRHFFDNDGIQAFILSLGAKPAGENANSWLEALQQPDLYAAVAAEPLITLLVVVEASELNQKEGNEVVEAWRQYWKAVLALCQARSDLFAILEAPDDTALIKRSLQDFHHEARQFGALYWPRLETSYQSSQLKILSPIGAVAAVIQSNDVRRGVGHAPANIALKQTIRPTKPRLEVEELYEESDGSLNLICSFPARGTRIWGCRTLAGVDSPWRYIQTRLLTSHVERQLSQLGCMLMFEPNNAVTWMKFKGHAGNLLRQLWLQGVLYGQREDEAFSVEIDENETMTRQDIDEGRMIARIHLALLAPAEFIAVTLNFDTRSGIATST
ncbi:phage tail sheath C-terminal domain-containing protein [Photorhabdus asymbiotica]|uniref:phage tail sheath C-terminal domain-containing protein n=1 Tax=Photorhabdus asymbiotica TaxID=291112 RepID=UPI003DA7A650